MTRELIETLRDMHVSSEEARGVGRYTDKNENRWTAYCDYDGQDWPCETVVILREHAARLPAKPKHEARQPSPLTQIGRQ
jgi:hypothetical protein